MMGATLRYFTVAVALAEASANVVERFEPAVVNLDAPPAESLWCEPVALFRVWRDYARALPLSETEPEVVLWRL